MQKLRSARTFLMGITGNIALNLSDLSNYGVGK